MENIISIVGVFLTIMLSINAFFLRSIFQDLNAVKIKMAEMFENSKGKDKRIEDLEEDFKSIEIRVRVLERSIK